jgi:hypothetical protein
LKIRGSIVDIGFGEFIESKEARNLNRFGLLSLVLIHALLIGGVYHVSPNDDPSEIEFQGK